ncbi:MAG: putative ABC transporter permease [Coriobacteriales bacterium]
MSNRGSEDDVSTDAPGRGDAPGKSTDGGPQGSPESESGSRAPRRGRDEGLTAPTAPDHPSCRDRYVQRRDARRQADREPDEALVAAKDDPRETRKIHIAFRIYGVLAMIGGIASIATLVGRIVALVAGALGIVELGGAAQTTSSTGVASIVIWIVSLGLSAILAVMNVRLGWKLLHNNRHRAGTLAYTMIALVVANAICDVMLSGLSPSLVPTLFNLVMLILISTFVDPSLVQERQLQRKLRDLQTREDAEAGGRDETGRGYITLNFFNLFWIFVVTSICGLLIEDLYRLLTAGVLESRAGLLYGPFSPIYGFGSVLMTIALNRFYKKSPLLIFVISALIGGAFEYLVSWFMQFAFGITAWDYSGPWFNADGSINLISFMNIDGRTSLLFMIFWGLLGMVWIRLLLPRMLKLINLIPWDWRYALTTVGFALLVADGVMTLISLDCWYGRTAGNEPVTSVEKFCATYYDDDFMQRRFQTMSINPDNATRVEPPELSSAGASSTSAASAAGSVDDGMASSASAARSGDSAASSTGGASSAAVA